MPAPYAKTESPAEWLQVYDELSRALGQWEKVKMCIGWLTKKCPEPPHSRSKKWTIIAFVATKPKEKPAG